MIDMGRLVFHNKPALGKMKIKQFAVIEEISWNAGVDLWGAARRLYHIPGVPGTSVCNYFFV